MSRLARRRDDLLLGLGGVVLALGAVVLFFRKEAVDEWADLVRLLILAIPIALLLLLGLARVRGAGPTAGSTAWQSGLLVVAVIMLPLALLQLVDVTGEGAHSALTTAWIFGVTAALAAFLAIRRGVPVAALLATLALLVTWLALWDQIADPAPKTVRHLIVIFAVLAGAAGLWLASRGERHGPEIVTGAGMAAVLAGVLGVFGPPIAEAAQLTAAAFTLGGLGEIQQQFHWDLFLLVVSLALVAYGTLAPARGAIAAGVVGLLVFVLSAGREVAGITAGRTPGGDLFGWPLALLLIGGAMLVAGAVLGAGQVARTRAGGREVEREP